VTDVFLYPGQAGAVQTADPTVLVSQGTTWQVTAAISGICSVSSPSVVYREVASVPAGAGSTTAAGVMTRTVTAVTSSSGSVSVAAVRYARASAVPQGSGSAAFTASMRAVGSSSVQASASLSLSGSMRRGIASSVQPAASITLSGAMRRGIAAAPMISPSISQPAPTMQYTASMVPTQGVNIVATARMIKAQNTAPDPVPVYSGGNSFWSPVVRRTLRHGASATIQPTYEAVMTATPSVVRGIEQTFKRTPQNAELHQWAMARIQRGGQAQTIAHSTSKAKGRVEEVDAIFVLLGLPL
jgi:hypothetical protein